MPWHMKAAGEPQMYGQLRARAHGQRNTIEHLRLQEETELRLFETLRHLKTTGENQKKYTHANTFEIHSNRMHAQRRTQNTLSYHPILLSSLRGLQIRKGLPCQFSNTQKGSCNFQQKITWQTQKQGKMTHQKNKTNIWKQSLKKHMIKTYFTTIILSMLKELKEIRKTYEWNESIYKETEIIKRKQINYGAKKI